MIEVQAQAQNIKNKILSSKKILLVTHKQPDSDALGSICALSKYLLDLNKYFKLFTTDNPPQQFSYLQNFKLIQIDLQNLNLDNFDLIISLDAGDPNHIGLNLNRQNNNIVNIDHHPTNARFGQINLIVKDAVSTTEILYNFFSCIKYIISPVIATCLLAGIIGDTNNFTNHNTTSQSLGTSAKLLSLGANFSFINESLNNKKSPSMLNLWGKALSRLYHNEKYNVALTAITQSDLTYLSDLKMLDGLTNFLNNLSGVKITMVLRETEFGQIKVSLRTNDDLVDLTEFVKIFNGGGHKKAAGFTISGKLEQTESGWQIV